MKKKKKSDHSHLYLHFPISTTKWLAWMGKASPGRGRKGENQEVYVGEDPQAYCI